MKRFATLLFAFALVATAAAAAASTVVFINEIHYNNESDDEGEAIEIAGPAGTSLNDWNIVLYDQDGYVYGSIDMTGDSIQNQQNGFGTVYYSYEAGIVDEIGGMALANSANEIIQFLSYGGAFEANDGLAAGWGLSEEIGVEESEETPFGWSLQLIGTGAVYEDFTWIDPSDDSFGAINSGQSFVPIPGAVWLLGSGLIGLVAMRRKLKK